MFRAPARVTFFFCLRRVTFVNSDKSNQKRHSRGKGFRFPFPLENPPSLKRPKGRGCDPSPLETSPRGVAIIKSRLCRSAAKVGGGQGPPEAKRRTDSHASDVGHWLGMTPLRGVRGDAPQGYLLRGERWAAFTQGRLDATALPWHTGRCGHRPLRKDKRCDGKMDGGRDTPRVLVPLRSTAWASPPTEGLSRVGSFNIQKEAPGGRFLLHILSPFYLLCG